MNEIIRMIKTNDELIVNKKNIRKSNGDAQNQKTNIFLTSIKCLK